jgi:hypothetical protein
MFITNKLRQLKYTGFSIMFRLLRVAIFRAYVSNKHMDCFCFFLTLIYSICWEIVGDENILFKRFGCWIANRDVSAFCHNVDAVTFKCVRS